MSEKETKEWDKKFRKLQKLANELGLESYNEFDTHIGTYKMYHYRFKDGNFMTGIFPDYSMFQIPLDGVIKWEPGNITLT